MKKIWYLFILSSLLLTACHDLPDEKSCYEVEKDLTELLESQNPYEYEFIKSVFILQKSDSDRNPSVGEDLTVFLYYYDDTSIGQDFALVRDTVLNYSTNNNYKFSSLMINTKKSDSEYATWYSYDLESGIYIDEIHGNTLHDVTLEELENSNVDSLTDTNVTEIIKDLKGRGISDSGRSEPQYVGVSGYVVVGYKQENDLERTDAFTETPWLIPTLSEDSNTLKHKTEVIVKSQNLKDEGWGRYSGQLTVEITDTKEETIIDVTNFITKPYWTYDDLTEASKIGYYIAEYHQRSSNYPVDRDNEKVKLEDGMKVLVVGPTGSFSGNAPNSNINSIEATVYKEWRNGYGGVNIYFNPQDLTLVY